MDQTKPNAKGRIRAAVALIIAALLAVTGALSVTSYARADEVVVSDGSQRGQLVIYKYDGETSKSMPQGGSSLEGATFRIWNTSSQRVSVYGADGQLHELLPNNQSSYFDIKVAWDADRSAYVAKTEEIGLPYGTYHVAEVSTSTDGKTASPGYYLPTVGAPHDYFSDRNGFANTSAPATRWAVEGYDFTIGGEGQVVTFADKAREVKTSNGSADYYAGPGCYNVPKRSGIDVKKIDKDTRRDPQGSGTLKGAIYNIYNDNLYPVVVWDHWDSSKADGITLSSDALNDSVDPGELVASVQTGSNALATTLHDTLPYGHYIVVEVKPPDGYDFDFDANINATNADALRAKASGLVWGFDNDMSRAHSGTTPVSYFSTDSAAAAFPKLDSFAAYGMVYANNILTNGAYSAAHRGYGAGSAEAFTLTSPIFWTSQVIVDGEGDGNQNTTNENPIKRGSVEIYKQDYDFDNIASSTTSAQGDARLGDVVNGGAGAAAINVYSDNDQTVVIYDQSSRTDNGKDYAGIRGEVEKGGKVATIHTDENGLATLHQLPVGKYHAVEADPSTGYDLTGSSEWYYEFEIADSDLGKCAVGAKGQDGQTIVTSTLKPSSTTTGHVNRSYNAASNAPRTNLRNAAYDDTNLREHVIRSGGITEPTIEELQDIDPETQEEKDIFGVKVDSDSSKVIGAGGATLAGTEVTVRNVSDYPVVWRDLTAAGATDAKTGRTGLTYAQRTWTIETPTKGDPAGRVDGSVTDFIAADGDMAVIVIVGIDKNGNVVVDAGNNPITMSPVVAREKPVASRTSEEVKAASIVGYVWRVKCYNANGTWTWNKLTDLPYGKYWLRETKAPTGYDINIEWGHLIEFHGKTGDLLGEVNLVDESARGDFGFSKKDENGQPMPNVAFRVTSQSTGETHILVTDTNGNIDTRAYQYGSVAWRLHNVFTNFSDDAVTDKDVVTDSKLYWQHGVWFYGYPNGTEFGDFGQTYGFSTPKELADAVDADEFRIPDDASIGSAYPYNSRGALPFDSYTVEELRCAANKGHSLVEPFTIDVGVHSHGASGGFIDLGTIVNGKYDFSGSSEVVAPGTDARAFVELTATPATSSVIAPGSDITYTLNYQNTSTETAKTLLIRDYIPAFTAFKSAANDGEANNDYVEWAVHDLEPGQGGSVSFTVTVNQNPANPLIVDQARYEVFDREVAPLGYAASLKGATNVVRHSIDGSTVEGNVRAKLTSTPITGSGVNRGDVIRYTIDLTNDGGAAIDNVGVFNYTPYNTTIAKADNGAGYNVPVVSSGGKVAGGGVGWFVGTIAAGATKTVSFAVTVDADAYGTIDNQASYGIVSSIPTSTAGPNATNFCSHSVNLSKSLEFAKSANVTSVAPGGEVTYSLTLTNTGESNIGPLTVDDPIPAHVTYVSASDEMTLTPQHNNGAVRFEVPEIRHDGGTYTVTWTGKVDISLATGDSVSNTATATDGIDTWTSNTVTTAIVDGADVINVTKSTDVEGGYVAAGDEFAYTVSWENTSDYDIAGLGIRDAIPEGTELVAGSTIIEQDGVSSASVPVAEHDPTIVRTGTSAEEGTFTEGTAALGGSYSTTLPDSDMVYRFVTATDESRSQATLVTDSNKAIPSWDAVDLYLGDSSRHAGDWIEFESTNAHAYNYLWHAVILDNGQIKLTAMYLTPSDSNLATIDGAKANYDSSRNAVRALIDSVGAHTTGSLTFLVKVTAADGAEIVNKATYQTAMTNLNAIQRDLEHETNEVKLLVGEAGVGSLTVEKSVEPEGEIHPGDELTYTIVATNDGTAAMKGVAVHDVLWQSNVKGVTLVPGSVKLTNFDEASKAAGAALDASAKSLGAYTDTIEPGESATMEFKVLAEDVVDGDIIKNTATYATEKTGVPTAPLENETNTVETPVGSDTRGSEVIAMLSQDKGDGEKLVPGDVVEYTLTFKNSGNGPAYGVVGYDPIPDGTTYVDGSLESDDMDIAEGDGYVAGRIAELAAGESVSFSFKATVGEERDVINTATWDENVDDIPTAACDKLTNDVDVVVEIPEITATLTQDLADGERVTPGAIVEYTLTLKNTGHGRAAGVVGFDAMPYGTSYVDGSLASSDNFEASAGDGYVSGIAESLAAGETATMTFKAKVDRVCDVVNKATWDIGKSEAPTANVKHETADVDVLAVAPNLTIVKKQDPPSGSTITWGDTLTYTITVTNNATIPAHNVAIYDWAPDHTTYVANSLTGAVNDKTYAMSGTRVESNSNIGVHETLQAGEDTPLLTMWAGDIAPGKTATMEFKATVDANFIGTIHNTAMWVAPAASPETTESEGASTNEQSDGVNANTGGVILAPMFAAPTVPIPDGAETGESNDTGDTGNTGDNTSDNGGSNVPAAGDNNGGSNDVSADVEEPKVQVTLGADVDDGAVVKPGDEVTYTIKVTNNGDSDVNGITIKDVLPKGLELVDGDLANDGKMTVNVPAGEAVEIKVKAKVTDDAVGAIKNEVKWHFAGEDTDRTSNSHVMFSTNASIQVIKSSGIAEGDTVEPGKVVTYTLAVTNISDAVKVVKVSDVLPAGLTYVDGSASDDGVFADGTLTWNVEPVAGETLYLTFKAKVAANSSPTLVNTATWKTDDESGTSGDHELKVATASLHLSKTIDIDGTEVKPGDVITYTVTIENTGAAAAKGVKVTDIPSANVTIDTENLPDGMTWDADAKKLTWSGDVEAESSKKLEYRATVNEDAEGAIRNVASVTPAATATDGIAANTLHVNGAEFTVTREVAPAYVKNGETANVTVTVTNTGKGKGTAHLIDTLPQGMTFAEVPSTLTVNADTRTATGDFTIAAGESETITYTVQAFGDKGDALQSESAVASGAGAAISARAQATVTIDSPEFSIEKLVDGADKVSAKPGDSVNYTIAVTNTSHVAGTVTVTDTMPKGLVLDTEGGVYVFTTRVEDGVTAEGFTTDIELDGGGVAYIEYTAVIADDASGSLVNKAVAEWSDGSATAEGTSDVKAVEGDAIVEVSPEGKVSIVKTTSAKSFKIGDEITYKVKVSNTTDKDIEATITDKPGEGLEFTNVEDGELKLTDKSGKELAIAEVTKSGSAKMTGVELKASESKTYYVKCKVTDKAKKSVENKASITWGDQTKTSSAKVAREQNDSPTLRENKGSLPETGTGAVVGLTLGGLGLLGLGAGLARRRMSDPTRMYRD